MPKNSKGSQKSLVEILAGDPAYMKRHLHRVELAKAVAQGKSVTILDFESLKDS